MKRLFLYTIILVVGISGYFYWISKSNISTLLPIISVSKTVKTPFEEITIPYLRKRNYNSLLSIQKKYSSNSSYTSYLSDYDSDGLKIKSLLLVPNTPAPEGGFPAVVFVHGYVPPDEYKTTGNYLSFVDPMARNGVVVLKIDLRGNGDSDGDPGGGYYSADYVIDTLNAFSALKNYPGINTNKIGLWGHSMAGNIILRSFVINPEIKKIVIWGGAVYTYEDMSRLSISDTSFRPLPSDSPVQIKRNQLTETYGRFDPSSSFWKQIPATNFLEGVTGSIQIHHAINDEVVNIEYSRNLIDLLNKSEIRAELFEYKSGGHNLTGTSFGQAITRSAVFLKE